MSKCIRCNNVLMGAEELGQICNACLDRPFDPMNIDDAAYLDEVPHCLACEENPAAADSLCLPCAKLRDAQPVRQENDAWGNRGGCSYRMEDEPTPAIIGRVMCPRCGSRWDNGTLPGGQLTSCPSCFHAPLVPAPEDIELCHYCQCIPCECAYRARVTGIPIGPIGQDALDERAVYQRIDDGYRKQAFVVRASALAR